MLSFPTSLSSRAAAFLSALACSRLCTCAAAACVCVHVLRRGVLQREGTRSHARARACVCVCVCVCV